MKRQAVLGIALLATLGASAWVAVLPDEEAPVVADALARPAEPAALPGPAGLASAPAAVPRPREAWGAVPRAALAAWSAPAAAAPRPAASAPVRQAPPKFPYAWIGRLDDSGDVQALLSNAERRFGARAGDVLDGRWRIERVAATRLQLSWLPTGETVNVELR